MFISFIQNLDEESKSYYGTRIISKLHELWNDFDHYAITIQKANPNTHSVFSKHFVPYMEALVVNRTFSLTNCFFRTSPAMEKFLARYIKIVSTLRISKNFKNQKHFKTSKIKNNRKISKFDSALAEYEVEPQSPLWPSGASSASNTESFVTASEGNDEVNTPSTQDQPPFLVKVF
jgi:hypothetical protein